MWLNRNELLSNIAEPRLSVTWVNEIAMRRAERQGRALIYRGPSPASARESLLSALLALLGFPGAAWARPGQNTVFRLPLAEHEPTGIAVGARREHLVHGALPLARLDALPERPDPRIPPPGW